MMICVKCGAVSPAKSTYCCGCGRGFGGRVCPSGHLSPPGAKFCSTCGRPGKELSEPTSFIETAAVGRIAAWGIAFAAVAVAVHHPADVATGAGSAGMWGLQNLFGITAPAIHGFLCRTAAYSLIIYMLTFLLPGAAGATARKWMGTAISGLPKALFSLAKGMWRLLTLIVEGRSKPENKGH